MKERKDGKVAGITCCTMSDKKTQSMLELLAECAGCPYLSDLHHIEGSRLRKLNQKLKSISPEEHSLREWNDALCYMTHESAQPSQSQARKVLIASLCEKG